MADVQTEHGYTMIANELMDAIIAKRIPAEVRRVFDYIIRMTYGYRRKTFETTHAQIALALNDSRAHISRNIKWLRERNMINGTEKCTVLERNHKTVLGIQKDFEAWNNGTKFGTVLDTVPKMIPSTVPKKVQSSSRKKKENKGDVGNGTQKRAVFSPPTGEQLRNNGHSWVDAQSWDDWVQHRKEIKKPLTPISVKKSLTFLSQFKTQHKNIIETSIRSGWQGLFPPKTSQMTIEPDGPRGPILRAPDGT